MTEQLTEGRKLPDDCRLPVIPILGDDCRENRKTLRKNKISV